MENQNKNKQAAAKETSGKRKVKEKLFSHARNEKPWGNFKFWKNV